MMQSNHVLVSRIVHSVALNYILGSNKTWPGKIYNILLKACFANAPYFFSSPVLCSGWAFVIAWLSVVCQQFYCLHSSSHSFDPVFIKFAQDVYLDDISNEIYNGWGWVKK